MHELSSIIEKKINFFTFHSLTISNKLESIIKELSEQYNISIKTLNHETSEIVVKTKSYEEVIIKTSVKNNNVISMTSPLLTSRLFENYNEMKKPLDLKEVYENLAISAEFQMILEESLKEYSLQALKVYNPGSFATSGIVCTANFYNEVHICYMKEMIVGVRISSFPYTIEVIDLAFFNPCLKKIRRLDGCLHHAMTKALKDDPDLKEYKNTVISGSPGDVYQILELHKPEHVKNALVILISYIHLNYLFEMCRNGVEEIVGALAKSRNATIFVYKMLDLRLELANFEEFRYNIVLKMKSVRLTGLEIDLDVETVLKRENEAEKLEKFKKKVLSYFNACIKPYYKGNLDLMVGFVRLFLVQLGLVFFIVDILDEEMTKRLNIEFLWSSLVIKTDSCKFSIKIWDLSGKNLDVLFSLIETAEGVHITTNLDPNFLSFMHQKDCTPVEILKIVCSRRLDELRLKVID